MSVLLILTGRRFDGTTEELTADKFDLGSGDFCQIRNLGSDDTGATLVATLSKRNIKAKLKTKNKTNAIITRHLHLHLIPRFGSDPTSEAWKLADLYRAVAAGHRPPASPEAVRALVEEARRTLLTSAP